MDWIQDNFQIVIIVLLALGSWLKARMDAKAAAQEEAAAAENYRPEDEIEIEEAEWQPPAAVPPPFERHAEPPALPAAVQKAAREAAAVLKHQQELAARLRQIREAKAVTTGGANATRLRLAAQGAAAKPLMPAPLSFRDRLEDRRELRRALVMREILNPPRGLG